MTHPSRFHRRSNLGPVPVHLAKLGLQRAILEPARLPSSNIGANYIFQYADSIKFVSNLCMKRSAKGQEWKLNIEFSAYLVVYPILLSAPESSSNWTENPASITARSSRSCQLRFLFACFLGASSPSERNDFLMCSLPATYHDLPTCFGFADEFPLQTFRLHRF